MGGALAYAVMVFTADWGMTSLVVVGLIVGAVFIRIGLREIRAITVASASGAAYRPVAMETFTGWRVFPPAGSEDVNRQLLLQRNQMLARALIGLGAGEILAALLYTGLLLGLYSAAQHDDTGQLSASLPLIAGLAGGAVWAAAGALKMRRNYRAGAASPGPRRSLWDYCSPWVWIIPVVVSALPAILLFAASLGAPSVRFHWFGAPVSIAAPVIGVLAATTLVLPVVLLLLMCALVARTRDILASADTLAARRANDDLRALVSASVIFGAWLFVIFPGTSADSLRSALGFSVLSGPLGALSSTVAVLQTLNIFGFLPICLIMLILASSGRMGGRLTGWPWRRWSRRTRPAIEE